jgi:5-methyltetrahydrofolate--homocysteine methyltransferase
VEEIHGAVSGGGRGHHRDEYVQRDLDLDGRLQLQHRVYDINLAAARLARKRGRRIDGDRSVAPAFVAGSMGPTNRTASISPDVNNPGFRGVTYDELVDAYAEQARGLIDGGADILLPETTFDTLNLKAAIFAIEKLFEEKGTRLPLMLSITITDASGRTLSGQTLEACWNSISHAPSSRVGINCALGGKRCGRTSKSFRQSLRSFSAATRMPAFRTSSAATTRPRSRWPRSLRDFAENGWLNIVGGCCGTTPDHIRAIAETVQDLTPRTPPVIDPYLRLSGLEALTVRPDSNFIMVGERTNVTGSPKFAKLILSGDYDSALSVARQQVDNGANILDINMDEGLLDSEEAMVTFLNLIAAEPDISRVPLMIDSSRWSVLEAG